MEDEPIRPPSKERRWDIDQRGDGVADASAAAGRIDALRAHAERKDWVAEEPDVHLWPHIERAVAMKGSPWTGAQWSTDPDGRLVVDLLPGGLEIENLNLTDASQWQNVEIAGITLSQRQDSAEIKAWATQHAKTGPGDLKYKDQNGDWQEETEWFRVVAWERLAETCNEYLRKGSKVYIEGRLQTRKWTGQDGQERQTVEVVANEMLLLDSRQQGGYVGDGGGYRSERPAAGTQPQRPAVTGGSSYEDTDTDMDVDDIPF